MSGTTDNQSPQAREALILGSASTPIWGLSNEERLRRDLEKVGISARHHDGGALEAAPSGPLVGLRGDYCFEPTLVTNLLETEGMVLCLDDGRPVAFHVAPELAAAAVDALERGVLDGELAAATKRVVPADLSYNKTLRKRATPYVLLISDEEQAAIEKRVFQGSYKGVTDIATKFFFPWPVRHLTKLSSVLRLTPNMVTTLSLGFTILTTWLWYEGQFGWGCVTGWAMCVLDSVDGKLARCTMQSSKWGNIFDHGIDQVHPPFWYWSFAVGLGASLTNHPYGDLAFWVIMGGYFAQRALEIVFFLAFGIEMHIWRPADSKLRLVTARRNPNLIILTLATLIGRPLEGFLVVGAWTGICLALHTLQVIQGGIAKANGRPIRSWLEESAPAA